MSITATEYQEADNDQQPRLHLPQSMIDYFEAGNRETEAAAKACIFSWAQEV